MVLHFTHNTINGQLVYSYSGIFRIKRIMLQVCFMDQEHMNYVVRFSNICVIYES